MRKLFAVAAALCLLLTAALPSAARAEAFSARTTLSGASDAKVNNVRLAAQAINGARVAAGETFSFNAVVGARTQSRGYRPALNGRGVMVTGGGVAQAATTLYLALTQASESVRIDEMAVYGGRFTDNYVADGRMAIITDYSAGNDFRFTNLGGDMDIGMWLDGEWLCCTVTWGDDANDGGSWFDDWSAAVPTPVPLSQVFTVRIPMTGAGGTTHNATLAAESVYDTTLATGDVFSFNRVVGPRTGQYGYVAGTNGRGAQVVGGGVAQVASVVWLAVKDMEDVAIMEKSTYGGYYSQRYVSSSADAILTDYNANIDFRFRYTGVGSITLYTYVQDGSLVCDVVRNG